MIDSIDACQEALRSQGYIAGRELATAAFLALRLNRPLFLEGEPGTGKTELAKALAVALKRPLIRLQCFEGLDQAGAAYEWNYARQMLAIKADANLRADDLFSRDYLLPRALLQAIESEPAAVLLIDELDRADEPFEAYLLEVLAEYQITIPELGTIRAEHPPLVVLTSNRTREVHDAIKRRCLYHWLDFPDAATEAAILAARLPEAPQRLTAQVVGFVQGLREMPLYKLPGVSESIEWSRALLALDAVDLDPALVQATLGLLLKYQDDLAQLRGDEALRLLERVRQHV